MALRANYRGHARALHGLLDAKILIQALETGLAFSSFLYAAKSGPGALQGPG